MVLVVFAAFLFLALSTYNPTDPSWAYLDHRPDATNAGGLPGAWFASVFLSLFGWLAWLVPMMVAWSGWMLYRERDPDNSINFSLIGLRWLGFIIILAAGAAFASMHVKTFNFPFPEGTGGILGQIIETKTTPILNNIGTTLLMIVLLLGGFNLFVGMSWLEIMEWIGAKISGVFTGLFSKKQPTVPHFEESIETTDKQEDEVISATYMNESLQKSIDNDFKIDPPEIIAEPFIEPPETTDIAPEPIFDLGDPIVEKEEIIIEDEKPVFEIEPFTIDSSQKTLSELEEERLSALENQKVKVEEEDDLFLETLVEPNADIAPVNIPTAHKEARSFVPKTMIENEPPPLPDIEFLDPPKPSTGGYSEEELESLSRQVERILKDFKIIVEVVSVQPGPVVTMFELDLAPGTKASKVSNLSTDLARALSKTSIRVVEVIPGKSVIGLEIPNEKRDMVYLREIIDSPIFKETDSVLTLAMGKDIVGNPVVADLGKMPHALIAGTTGSGKSVAINTMILSLLYKATPREVRLIMVDPKMLELSVYDGIPHLLSPVVTDMEEAANSLRWAVVEMERRYKLMSAMGVRNLAGFNKIVDEAEERGESVPDPIWQPAPNATLTELHEQPTLEHMPYVVIIIDELADMMMVVGKKVEELIARLAQKARAAGIHLLLATQRPSVDVITGLIKANVPSRLAFKVSSKIDSRTILDQMGAEALLGYGDSLFTSPANNIPMRTHGAFVDDHEVHNVANFLRSTGGPNYVTEITDEPSEPIVGLSAEASGVSESESSDPLFNEAVQFVTETGRGSISGIQRRLKIGYNRAARMIEYMEEMGIVSPPENNGNRRVLVSPPPSSEI